MTSVEGALLALGVVFSMLFMSALFAWAVIGICGLHADE